MHRWQKFVAVAEVVLAELSGGVTERLECFRYRHVFCMEAHVGTRLADLRQAGADRRLPGDEGGAAGGATLLGVIVGENRTLSADAINVRRPVTHDAEVVGADVEPADVVGHDHKNVWLASRWSGGLLLRLRNVNPTTRCNRRCGSERCATEQHVAVIESAVFPFRLFAISVAGHLSLPVTSDRRLTRRLDPFSPEYRSSAVLAAGL